MDAKEHEYKSIFLAEAMEQYEALNVLLTDLEKQVGNEQAIHEIFRITHTLKGNAMGLGFEDIGAFSHVLEDVFSEMQRGTVVLDSDLFNTLFKANDKLGELIVALSTGEPVQYRGLKAKLEVLLRKVRGESLDAQEDEEDAISPAFVEENGQQLGRIGSNGTRFAEVESAVLEEAPDMRSATELLMINDTVQIPVSKLDNLLNLAGELIIEKDSLMSKESLGRGSELARLHRITSDLQYGVMDVRLVQVGFLFNKFHRIVRDAAVAEGKQVDLQLSGTEIEIDRNILKIMSDSLVHLVRNAVSHGIEAGAERAVAKKPAVGSVTLRAHNEKDAVIIEVSDDGKGMDVAGIRKKAIKMGLANREVVETWPEERVIQCIFEPGFSNASEVSALSGRGVGMDVVKQAASSVGGSVKVLTEKGVGTTIRLSLPSSMAVKGALLFELAGQEFAIALAYTESVISLTKAQLHLIGHGLMAKYQGQTIPVVFLKDLFALDDLQQVQERETMQAAFHALSKKSKMEVVIVAYDGKQVGLVVDKLLQQKEIVEKALGKPLDQLPLFSGATILGNGKVCLVLDVISIVHTLFINT